MHACMHAYISALIVYVHSMSSFQEITKSGPFQVQRALHFQGLGFLGV